MLETVHPQLADKAHCTGCGACAENCPTGALTLCGAEMSAEEVFAEVRKDWHYYEASGGGVTLSGGECLLYPVFVARLLKMCREAGIHMEYQDTPGYGSAYVEGIGNLYEFDGGALSGWMYRVNGTFPNKGCSAVAAAPGDRVEWVYTCDLGRDVGGGDSGQLGA